MKSRPPHSLKDSELPWAPLVPRDWTVLPLKRLVDMRSGNAITADQINEVGEYPVFGGNGLRGYTDSFTHEGEFPLIGRQGALCGNIHYGVGRFYASEHAIVATPKVECSVYWLGELMRAMQLGQYSTSAAQPGIGVEIIRDLQVPVPPLPEQLAIAAFLDRETAKIDALVAEQERLIALLAEKRRAVISHAVTKGLEPDVPVKDSGIAWLGEVPVHWEVKQLRRIVAAIEQGWSPECLSRPAEDLEWGVLKAGCTNGGLFSEQENKALPPELAPVIAYEVRPGDILMSRANGSPKFVGSTAYVSAVRARLLLSDKIYRVRLAPDAAPEWFVALMGATIMRDQIVQAISGAEGLANNLPQSSLKEFLVPVPPRDEQCAISKHIAIQTAKLDTLTTEAERAIALLKERRAALISAAVTGKIDVRNAVAAEEVAA